MKIYIAARYKEVERNEDVKNRLNELGLEVYLPWHELHEMCEDEDSRERVARHCLEAITKANIVLGISPYGNDVSFELGYALGLQAGNRGKRAKKRIVLWHSEGMPKHIDDMIDPKVDFQSESLEKVIQYINKCNCRTDIRLYRQSAGRRGQLVAG